MVQWLLIYGSKNITYVFNSYAKHGARFNITSQGARFDITSHGVWFDITSHGARFDITSHGVWFDITSHGSKGQVLRLRLGIWQFVHHQEVI